MTSTSNNMNNDIAELIYSCIREYGSIENLTPELINRLIIEYGNSIRNPQIRRQWWRAPRAEKIMLVTTWYNMNRNV